LNTERAGVFPSHSHSVRFATKLAEDGTVTLHADLVLPCEKETKKSRKKLKLKLGEEYIVGPLWCATGQEQYEVSSGIRCRVYPLDTGGDRPNAHPDH
ncbi:MAG: hypothetical protein OES99_11905, partial [Gammaproteobacteria bacterium]|nr:hypothetical protein [Gammaproteobacteria bacterium]